MALSEYAIPADASENLSSVGHPMAVLGRPISASIGVVEEVRKLKILAGLGLVPQEIPERFGRYAVLDVVGQGGMGTVLTAYDEELDRAVAIKLLRPDLAESDGLRLKREAQALAKLSHPNVIHVYEVGEIGGQTFVAMELVKQGRTLAEWVRREPRPSWRECVQVYLQAGAGLAAAHAEGLVHRDFKPSNVIIDDKGLVRVLDFGLARQARESTGGESGCIDSELLVKETALNASLTRTGAVIGTLAYMPLEQLEGELADARSDQFSFCVSLWEAVHGTRPFEGRSVRALSLLIREGLPRYAPRGGVPPKLRYVLLRGLAARREARWSSMDALLAELRKLLAPKTARLVAGGVIGGLMTLGVGLGVEEYIDVMNRCAGAKEQLAGIWDEGRRSEVEAAIRGTGVAYALGTWDRVSRQLDDYARGWVEKHDDVCKATALLREQSEEDLSLRMSCLQERRTELNAAVTVLAESNEDTVPNAVALISSLREIDRCDDVGALRARRQRIPPPEDPEIARDVAMLRDRLAHIGALEVVEGSDQAFEEIVQVAEQAEALGYAPLLAEVMWMRGHLRTQSEEWAQSEKDLLDAYSLAAELGYDELMENAVIDLSLVTGYGQGRYGESLAWAQMGVPLARRRENGLSMVMSVERVGVALLGQDRLQEAEDQFRQALLIGEKFLSDGDGYRVATVMNNLGLALARQGKFEEAEMFHLRAIQAMELVLGYEHPDVGRGLHNLILAMVGQQEYEEALSTCDRAIGILEDSSFTGTSDLDRTLSRCAEVAQSLGRYGEAEEHHRRLLRLREDVFGLDDTKVADCLYDLGIDVRMQGKAEEAEGYHRKSIEIGSKAIGDDNIHVAAGIDALGLALQGQGRYQDAELEHRRALAMKERHLGSGNPGVAKTMVNVALSLERQQKYDAADQINHRALDILVNELGENHPLVGHPLVGLAEVALAQEDFDNAQRYAERAVSVWEAGEMAPGFLAEARFVLARALWADPHERARARDLAVQAHGASPDPARTKIVEEWLLNHRMQ